MSHSERDRLVEAVLPDVPFDGWSRHALLAAGRRLGIGEAECVALFPGGPRDLVAQFSRWADRRMLARLDHLELDGMKIHERVAAAVMARLEGLALHREAARHALAVLAWPLNAPLAARLLYETVDAIWFAVGDEATDFSFYTKRTMLAGIYAATTLYWLEDRSANFTETRAFLDRRLREVAILPRWRAKLASRLEAVSNPFRTPRTMRGGQPRTR
jgi:ubiquinone biosynthesis protein COQ9